MRCAATRRIAKPAISSSTPARSTAMRSVPVNGSVLFALAVCGCCAAAGVPLAVVGAELLDGEVPPAWAPRTSWFGVLVFVGAVVDSGDVCRVPRTACPGVSGVFVPGGGVSLLLPHLPLGGIG